MTPPALVAVLAGGRGRRMGRPKAGVLLGGRPLVAWPLAAASAAGLEAVVVAKPGAALPPDVGAEIWEEPPEPSHPLTGLVAALERAEGRAVVALAVDMPFVPAALVARLAAAGAVTAPRLSGRLHPFPARYEQSSLPVLREALAREAPVREALAALSPSVLGEEELAALGDPARMLAGVNTPEELAAAERSLAG